jgi:hypothetical protein
VEEGCSRNFRCKSSSKFGFWPFLGFSRRFARGKFETAAADAGGRLTPPSQRRQDVLGAAILAFREPLAQLAEDRARHAVAL